MERVPERWSGRLPRARASAHHHARAARRHVRRPAVDGGSPRARLRLSCDRARRTRDVPCPGSARAVSDRAPRGARPRRRPLRLAARERSCWSSRRRSASSHVATPAVADLDGPRQARRRRHPRTGGRVAAWARSQREPRPLGLRSHRAVRHPRSADDEPAGRRRRGSRRRPLAAAERACTRRFGRLELGGVDCPPVEEAVL